MKLTKSELKLIVKECLLEILNEGLGGQLSQNSQNYSPQPQKSFTPPSVQQPALESRQRPVQQQQSPLQLTPRRPPPQHMREVVKREAGGNKVMESILADTAASTLQKMIQNEGRQIPSTAGGGVVEHLVAAANPEEIFGDDVTSKWASLAFMDGPTKK